MSTPATYLIASHSFSDYKKQICFYIEYDGYPEGAAEYFYAMHHCANKKGGYAERFIRANEEAEFIDEPDRRPNIAYCYDLRKDGSLSVYESFFAENVKIWRTVYKGTWYDFVNEHLQLEGTGRLYNFTVDVNQPREVMSLGDAVKRLDEMKASIKKEHPNDNKEHMRKYLKRIKMDVMPFAKQVRKLTRRPNIKIFRS